MVGDHPDKPLVHVMHIAQEPSAVQRVKPSHGKPRRIPDVVQDRCRNQQLGITSQPGSNINSGIRDSL